MDILQALRNAADEVATITADLAALKKENEELNRDRTELANHLWDAKRELAALQESTTHNDQHDWTDKPDPRCPRCRGYGKYGGELCDVCRGSGTKTTKQQAYEEAWKILVALLRKMNWGRHDLAPLIDRLAKLIHQPAGHLNKPDSEIPEKSPRLG